MSQIKFGIIGAGAIAYTSCKSINSHESATIVAAHDPHPGRLKDLCDANDIDHGYASVDELLGDDDVDVISIAVPNKFHAPLAVAALEAGKHVVLDKPFALNVEEALGVVEAAKQAGKSFTLGMNQRFVESHQKIKTLVDKGVLGEIYHAKAYWKRRSGIPRLGTWFGNKEMAGGGALLDIGVHMLDLCLYTIGNFEVEAVSGATYTKFGNRGLGEGGWGRSDREGIHFDVDDFATALIKLKGGQTVSLDATWAAHQEHGSLNNVELFGTEAGATVSPAKVFRAGDISDYDVIDNVKADLKYPHKDRFHNFINHLLGEEELCTTIEQALAVQRILDAIYESAATGHEVRLDQPVTV